MSGLVVLAMAIKLLLYIYCTYDFSKITASFMARFNTPLPSNQTHVVRAELDVEKAYNIWTGVLILILLTAAMLFSGPIIRRMACRRKEERCTCNCKNCGKSRRGRKELGEELSDGIEDWMEDVLVW